MLDDAHFALAGRAIQLLDWDRNHRYCGRCGTPTEAKAEERARACPACRLSAYPRIAPAVMALVRREGEILLGRSPHFPPGMYSALAGFVEPGETLEQCLAREVEEEVGVRVSRIRYFASQPWPFPNSLMIAFVCDWAGGEIRPQAGEIEDAKWFDVLQLPKLPSRISIARRLIDAVVGEMRADGGFEELNESEKYSCTPRCGDAEAQPGKFGEGCAFAFSGEQGHDRAAHDEQLLMEPLNDSTGFYIKAAPGRRVADANTTSWRSTTRRITGASSAWTAAT